MVNETYQIKLDTLAELKGVRQTLDGLKGISIEAKNAQKSTSSTFQNIQKSISGIPAKLGAIAAGAFALQKIGAFLADSVKEAIEAERQLSKLQNALNATNENTKENIKSFKDFASELQSASRFGDDLIISQIALAKNFGLTNQRSKDLVATAANLSAVLGSDLESSTQQLLKSLTGQLPRELKLLGPEFAKLTAEQLKSGAAIDLISQKFAGRAAADAKTLFGSVQQLGNVFSDFKEKIGDAIISTGVFQGAVQGLTSTLKQLGGLETDIERLERFKKALDRARFDAGRQIILKKQILEIETKINGEAFAKSQKEIDDFIKDSKKAIRQGFDITIQLDQEKVQSFLDGIKTVGKSSIEIAKQERDARIKLLNETFGGIDTLERLSVENKKLYADAKFRIEKDLNDKVKAENEKRAKEEADALRKRLQVFSEAQRNIGQAFAEIVQGQRSPELVGGVAAGLGQNVVKGAAGGRELLGAAAVGAGAAIGGPAGAQAAQAIAPIIQELSKGKDAAKAFVTEFLNSIPDMILGLVDGITQAAVSFVEQVPLIIERFIEGIPAVIENLINALPQVAIGFANLMPTVAIRFATSLIEQAPAIAESIIKAIGNAPRNAGKSFGKILGFDSGGQVVQRVPAGFGAGSSERFPALLGSGELVVDRSTAYKLQNFLSREERSSITQKEDGGMMDAILALANRPVIVQLEGREIARAVRGQMRSGLVMG
jgi:hypothetical protein